MKGVTIHGHNINNIRFAGDIDLIEESFAKLQESLNRVTTDVNRTGLKMNVGKTKALIFVQKDAAANEDGQEIENVDEYVYL